jgi:crotonobetainyl-CoA:carnitine CoA-transferase CaiB-like acyl-CoA transferase
MTNQALRTIFDIAGWPESRTRAIEVSGGYDPILPTPFRITETGTAALTAIGLAVSDLWEIRTGRPQKIAIDTRRATASLRSGHYLVMEGQPVDFGRHTIMGVYPAKNGRWSYLHCNFPNHREAALKVLGVPEDRAAVRKAVAQWDAQELEEAIIAAKGAGGMVRTMREWAEHPQGKAVAALPLMEIIKIGDAPPQPLPPGERPLSGVRVLDLTRVLAGPVNGRTLAAHGADVLRVTGPHLPGIPGLDADTGRGKLSAHIDLRGDDGKVALARLLESADIFVQGYRPGGIAERGFSPGQAARLRPGIVYVSLCAWSHMGPWASRRGFDSLVQTATGINRAEAEVAGVDKPVELPCQALDHGAGYLMAAGAMTALKRRAEIGGSWLVRLSLAQVGHWMTGLGRIPEGRSATTITRADVPHLLGEMASQYGVMSALRHAGQLSETPPRWDRPSVPLGTHPAAWPLA